ncbi:hypothetical protein K461DRAFT_295526 [Myriangium duriaei CBS 260.36]|uniref:Aminoglycoside phosphotransferase domain-containing protein n=1 Tax=Myriangium duriaei CBS 260.36 TaxID=1168546 RepID=A0A9P4IX09_9PEZI|nr:hypothetical protein K461DRAFT_295526 [Myriangium duriaei CBS 260.36]
MSDSLSKSWNEESVADFFNVEVPAKLGPQRASAVTPQTCTQLAKQVLKTEDLQLVDFQGAASFTLISHDAGKIFQVRRSILDDGLLALAAKVYQSLTPSMLRLTECNDFPLPVYIADIVAGTHMIHLLPTPPDLPTPEDRFYQTAIDLARFHAKALQFPQETCQTNGWTSNAQVLLDGLLKDPVLARLAPELLPVITESRTHLHLLDTLPPVLTHADLGVVNLFADEQTGALTGVIDWDHATIERFGMTIWSLYENFLSCRSKEGIVFYEQPLRSKLENAFWGELRSSTAEVLDSTTSGPAVRAAAVAGAITRYLDLETLEDETEDHEFYLQRAKGFLPAMPKVIESDL